jgi:hypothetical protein
MRVRAVRSLKIFQMGEAEGGAEVFAEVDPVLFWDGGKDFDDLGIELRAGAAANFFAGVALWAELCGKGGC